MELIFRICLFVAGVINFIPSFLAFIPSKISSSYGIAVPTANYELLLRHRAVMLGIIGGFMIYAAISKKQYSAAIVLGMISMVSFVIFYVMMKGEINPQLTKVMKMDVLAIVILLIGLVAYKFR